MSASYLTLLLLPALTAALNLTTAVLALAERIQLRRRTGTSSEPLGLSRPRPEELSLSRPLGQGGLR